MNTKEEKFFPELSKFKESGHSLVTAMNMVSQSLVDFAKERDRLLAEIEQLKKQRAELEADAQ
jgi:cell shape-determining protein MreC